MILADTSIWIEFFKQNSAYRDIIFKLLKAQQVLAVECIFGELLQGAKDDREREIITAYWENLPQCPSHQIWIEAGRYSSKHHLLQKGVGLIDCVILLSAKKTLAKVWTLDKKLNAVLRKEERFIF